MDDRITLKATVRDLTGKQVKAARREGKLPAVIYGKAVEKPISIYLTAHETNLILHKVGPTKLIDIEVGGEKYPVLVKERQRNVIYGNYIHLDFLAISMTERLRAAVPIALVGDAPVVKDYNAYNEVVSSIQYSTHPSHHPDKKIASTSETQQSEPNFSRK